MIRAAIALLFANGPAPEYVLGVGFVTLPGAAQQHGRHRNERRLVRSNGKASNLSGGASA